MPFGNHEMLVRVTIEGAFERPRLHAWLGIEAERLGVHGWSREQGGDAAVQALFAGDVSSVLGILQSLREPGRPDGIAAIAEGRLRGDEPVWLGFHHLPPAG